jgi:hypothetical protein
MLLHLYVRIVWISSIDKAGGEEKSFHLLTVRRPRSAASQPKVGSLVDLSVNTRRAGSDEEVLKKGEDYIRRGRDGLACCSRHDRHDRLGVRLLYDRFYPRS